jgi:hypothetical protein
VGTGARVGVGTGGVVVAGAGASATAYVAEEEFGGALGSVLFGAVGRTCCCDWRCGTA